MSLDVYLIGKQTIKRKKGSGIFVRDNGRTIDISEKEWNKRNPGRVPVRFNNSETETNELFSANITHNLGEMAVKAGIYYALWRPEEKGWKYAEDIIPFLEKGLKDLRKRPTYFEKFNPENGWGTYGGLVEFVDSYLKACREYPDAEIQVSR